MDAIKDYLVENIADEESNIICRPAVNFGSHRSKRSKWRVTKKEYPHEKYPNFCFGSAGVILSRKTVNLLLAQVERTPFLWLEGVFTTGLLRANAGIGIISLKANTTVYSIEDFRARHNQSAILFGPISLKPNKVQEMWDLHRRCTLTS
jgi:Galactosyltransferase